MKQKLKQTRNKDKAGFEKATLHGAWQIAILEAGWDRVLEARQLSAD